MSFFFFQLDHSLFRQNSVSIVVNIILSTHCRRAALLLPRSGGQEESWKLSFAGFSGTLVFRSQLARLGLVGWLRGQSASYVAYFSIVMTRQHAQGNL